MPLQRLKAVFSGAMGDGSLGVLLIQPWNEEHQGERLQALAKAAVRAYRSVNVVLDDATGGETAREAMEAGFGWLDENRDNLEDRGISLERLTRWSEFPFLGNISAELQRLYGENREIRSVMNGIAFAQSGKQSDVAVVREQLPLMFQRLAGLIYIRGLTDVPVIAGANMPVGDPQALEKARGRRLTHGLLNLPEFVSVSYVEDDPQPKPPAQVFPVRPSAEILAFRPRGT